MSNTFMTSPSLLFTSESVTEGHPDKICDQISDAILDEALAQDPWSRVALETAVKTGFVVLLGEITTKAIIDYDKLVRQVILDIGYDNSEKGFDGHSCGVLTAIAEQSRDIDMGVSKDDGEVGAGDQGMVFGYACNETEMLMPLPIDLAHKLSKRLAYVRKSGLLPWVRPDGKTQVTVEYSHGRPRRVHTVLVSTQHSSDIEQDQIRKEVIEHVINPVIPPELVESEPRILVNPTGRFVTGGPMGDAGLTGRKIIVDTYGGMGRHGGGAFSGKDPTKVDRSAAYAARWIAKNVVAAGLSERCEVQIAYAIGKATPLSVSVETFGTGKYPPELIEKVIADNFDLRPAGIIDSLDLRRPIYRATSNYGHFGRAGFPWESTDKVDQLRSAAQALAAKPGLDRSIRLQAEYPFD